VAARGSGSARVWTPTSASTSPATSASTPRSPAPSSAASRAPPTPDAADLAVVVSRIRGDAGRALASLLFGAVLYLANFLVEGPIAFPVFEDANQPLEVATYLVFGSVAVVFLLGRNPGQTSLTRLGSETKAARFSGA
jgi:hypothetical protein